MTVLSYKCETCGFALYIPVIELAVSVVGLYDDARFPGRCVLALKPHHVHLDEVPSDLAAQFLHDGQQLGAALRSLGLGTRVNYAVLGNTDPHVHMHVFPRGLESDALPARPPWEHPAPRAALPKSVLHALTTTLRNELE